MISLKEAKQLVLQQATSYGSTTMALDDALGHMLVQPIVADRDYPPFNRATMDGIAICFTDWENGFRDYKIVETIFAGSGHTTTLRSGECYKIMTGAAVPGGADSIIRREDCCFAEEKVSITVSHLVKGQNIALKGSDLQKGKTILQQPQRIQPGTITMLASLGYSQVEVATKPRVAIITTGNEVVPVHEPVSNVQIRNSNAALLKALLQQSRIHAVSCTHVADDTAALHDAIGRERDKDIIILSGAVSAGDADFVPEVLQQAGAEKIFHQVAIRPGKPIWFGKFNNGPIVFALPGNPFSTFVTYKLFIESFLAACSGLPPIKSIQLRFTGIRSKKSQLDEFFPVVFEGNPTAAKALPFNNSGDITAMMLADALGVHPADQAEIKMGEVITCML